MPVTAGNATEAPHPGGRPNQRRVRALRRHTRTHSHSAHMPFLHLLCAVGHPHDQFVATGSLGRFCLRAMLCALSLSTLHCCLSEVRSGVCLWVISQHLAMPLDALAGADNVIALH
jgi:hypothetical protein